MSRSLRFACAALLLVAAHAVTARDGCAGADDFPAASAARAKTTPVDIRWTEFVPMVILPTHDPAANLVYRAYATGAPQSLRLELSHGGGNVFLLDNGAGADTVAGDGIYSTHLAAGVLLSRNVPERHGRPIVGGLSAIVGGVPSGGTINEIGNVAPPDMPNYLVALRIGAPFQYRLTSHVINYVDDAYHDTLDYAATTQRILPRLGDYFDFVDVVTATRGYTENRFHGVIRNDIAGIGVGMVDNGAAFGSPARLKGFTVFPNVTFYDPQARAYNHEVGHQWINALDGTFADAGSHWPIGPLASDVMGWSGDGGQGQSLSCTLTRSGGMVNGTPSLNSAQFNPYELYLMGLMSAAQVPASFQFADQAAARALIAGGNWCRANIPLATIGVDVQTIIGANGVRSPGVAQSQKVFKVLTIAPSRGRLLDDTEMRYLTWLAQRGDRDVSLPVASGLAVEDGTSFFRATGGRARLEFRRDAVFRGNFE